MELVFWKRLDAGTDRAGGERATEYEMVGWHHQLKGHGSEKTLGNCQGQGGLACYSPWGHNESDSTEQLYNNISLRKT